MYPEFIAVYVGIGIVLIFLLVILILMIVLLSKVKKIGSNKSSYYGGAASIKTNSSIVFCKKCASEFDSAERFCPKCGTPR